MSREFAPLGESIAADWDRLVEDSPDGWVFSLSAWQRMILAVPRWQLRDHSFAVYENGKMVAAMPLQWSSASKRMSSSGWGGSGPVIAGTLEPAERERVMSLTLDHARKLSLDAGAAAFDFSISPVTTSSIGLRWGVNPFALHGLKDVSQLSQVIDLSQSEAGLSAGVSSKTRSMLRKAAADGITVRRVDWSEYLDEYYAVHQETYARTGVQAHPKEYFSGIARYIAPAGHAVLFAAFSPTGQAIAFHNSARFREGAYYHTGCSRVAALANGTNHLLFWNAVMAARHDGCRWFDAGAVDFSTDDEKLRTLTIFKTRFGGEPHRLIRSEIKLETNAAKPGGEGDAEAFPVAGTGRPAQASLTRIACRARQLIRRLAP